MQEIALEESVKNGDRILAVKWSKSEALPYMDKEQEDSEWQLISECNVERYKCGLKAGGRVRLKSDLVIRDHLGQKTGEVYKSGEIWVVLPGAKDDPEVAFFERPDGKRHTWDDKPEIFDWFEIALTFFSVSDL